MKRRARAMYEIENGNMLDLNPERKCRDLHLLIRNN
jgi:hypothetical protein